MDPLTAIGLVSNILSFIDFSARLLKGAKEVHDSQHGVLEENRSREAVVREMQRMSTQMLVPEPQQKADDNSSLRVLARECCELSTQLISLLEKIKPKDPGSTTQSIASALRNKIYDSERASLEMRLSDCRAQLHLELSNLTRTETLEKLESLIQASKLDETKLDRIESHIAQLRESISLAPSTSEDKPLLMRLLAEEEKVFTTIAQDRILRSLSFEGMNRRSNMVVETHSNTYEWILEDDSTADQESTEGTKDNVAENASDQPQITEDAEKVRARDKLRTWLESETSRDVFHLSGKLGSGKSTLMKHVRASPVTEEKLRNWAAGRKLTIVDFYFWNIGSDYEKSLQGLYTSLLYQIFSQCPEFISKVWPAQWATANSAPWLVSKVVEVSEKDIIQAFSRVIDSHDVLENHCFAFFIDGLDEFQSTVQDDHRDLVKLLCRWAASPSGNIKICVSSREYPVFMDGFSPNLRIRFHELTRCDMDIYIRDKLAHANTEDSFEGLVSSIMSKADGVFLWVALVVKSLREGLEDGLSCSDLAQEVDILPDQLESLYKHILMSLGKTKRRKAYQTFSMVMELKRHGSGHYRMSLLAYSFLEDYEAEENFFMNKSNAFPKNKLTGHQGEKRAENSRRRLAGWCKGLVEPYERPGASWDRGPRNGGPCIDAWKDWSMELDFAHRSISDFLKSDEVQRDMQLNLRHFDHVDAVLNLVVSDLLYENGMSIYNTSRSGFTSAVILRILDHHNLLQEPYTYLERIRELLAGGNLREAMSANTILIMVIIMQNEQFGFWQAATWTGDDPEVVETVETTSETASEVGEDRSARYHYITDPLYAMILHGPCDYPLWYINNSSNLSSQPEMISELACICISGLWIGSPPRPHEHPAVLESLFRGGWLSPDTITAFRPTIDTPFWKTSPGDFSGLTVWQYLLISMLAGRYNPTMNGTTPARGYGFKPRAEYLGRVLKLFLQFKPDIEFSFDISVNEETTVSNRDFTLNFGKKGRVFRLRAQCPSNSVHGDWRRPWQESEVGLPSDNGSPASRHFSLREFIELSFHDNKAELLKILDEQSSENLGDRSTRSTLAAGEEGRVCDHAQPEDDGDQAADASAPLNFEPTNHFELQHHVKRSSQWAKNLLKTEYIRYSVAVLTGVILTILFTYIRERVGRMFSV